MNPSYTYKNNGALIIAVLLALCLLPVVFAAPIFPTVTANTSLYFQFDNNITGENASNIADVSGNLNNGTLFTGLNGLQLNATGGFAGGGLTGIGIGTANSTRVQSNINVSGWGQITFGAVVRPAAFVNNAPIVSFRSTSFGLRQSTSSYICSVSNSSADATQAAAYTVSTTGSYHYVVCTYDGSRVRIYYDGILRSTSSAITGPINFSPYSSPPQGPWIGRLKGGAETTFNGTIDEFIIENRSLTDAQIWERWQNYNSGCTTPVDGDTFYGDTKICSGSYSINGSTSGGLKVIANNSVIDGNGATIYGNFTAGAASFIVGLTSENSNNVTIKNFRFTDYYHSLKIGSESNVYNNTFNLGNRALITKATANSSNIYNNSFNTSTVADIYFAGTGIGISNLTIQNNTFTGTNGAYRIQSFGKNVGLLIKNNVIDYISSTSIQVSYDANGAPLNITVQNNNFTAGSGYAIDLRGGMYGIVDGNQIIANAPILTRAFNHTIIRNNNLTSSYVLYSSNIIVGLSANDNDFNVTVINNSIRRSHYGILLDGSSSDVTVISNNIEFNDIGSTIQGTNQKFINNTVSFPTPVVIDTFNIPLKVGGCVNCNVTGNTFKNLTNGLFIQNSTNVLINQNNFSFIPLAERANYPYSNYRDPMCAIKVTALYESWLTGGQEIASTDNISHIGQYSSNRVNISGNNFESTTTQCYLQLEGTENLSHDLSNYWFRSFQTPTYLKEVSSFYNNPLFENLSWATNTSVSDLLYATYFGSSTLKMQYSLHQNWSYFKNANTGTTYQTNVYNLTNALVYANNGTAICTNIPTCTNVSYNLSPLNYSYVLDNYSVNQSRTRLLDPITVATGSSNVRTLTSNLTSTLTNVPVTLLTSGIVPSSPRITYPNGSSEYPAFSHDSVAGTITFNGFIPPGVSTVTLDTIIAENGCSSSHSPIIDCDEFEGLSDVGGEIGSFMVNILPGLFKLIVFLSLAVGLVLLFGVAADAIKKGGFGGF